MNRKFIKTISLLTCALGICSIVPFVSTSCGSKKSDSSNIINVQSGYTLPNIYGTKGNYINWQTDLAKHIVDKDGNLIRDYKNVKYSAALPKGLKVDIDQDKGLVHVHGSINAIAKGTFNIKVTYNGSSTTATANYSIVEEKILPLKYLSAVKGTATGDNNYYASTNSDWTTNKIISVLREYNTIYIPNKLNDSTGTEQDISGIADYAFCEGGYSDLSKLPADNHIFIKFDSNSSIKTIGEKAFRFAPSLSYVEIPEGVTEIKKWAFSSCMNLNYLSLPSTLTKIGDYSFYDNKYLASVQIPENTTTIGKQCFYGCNNLGCISLPNSVSITSSMQESFRGDILTDVTLTGPENTVTVGYATNLGPNARVLLEKPASGDIEYKDDGTTANTSKVIGTVAYGDLIFPSTVTQLPDTTTTPGFSGAKGITSIDLPKELTSIGQFCFYTSNNISAITYHGNASSFKNITFGNYWLGGNEYPANGVVYAPTDDDAQAILEYLNAGCGGKFAAHYFDSWTAQSLEI